MLRKLMAASLLVVAGLATAQEPPVPPCPAPARTATPLLRDLSAHEYALTVGSSSVSSSWKG